MKKLIFSLSMFLAYGATNAQPILLPNGDFENWTNLSYDNPNKWDNSNLYTVYDYGFANVSKVAGATSGYAIRLETKVSGMDTVAAYFSNSDDPTAGEGGVPYTFQATNFHGAYRYNITAGDTAWILLKFKKNGSVISDTMYPITGSQSTFTYFTFPVPAMAQAPDTLIVAAASGNVNSYPKAGSWLELDELSFSDNIMNVIFPDGDFETWTNFNVDNATNWINSGYGEVSKTTDNYSGTYAMKLVSKDDGTGYIEEAIAELGLPNQMPGMPFTKKVDTLTGYYMYNTTGTDMGAINTLLTDANGTPVGPGAALVLQPAPSYKYFELPISAPVTPAVLMVSLTSSMISGSGVDGSTLIIDNLRLKNSPNSVGKLVNDNGTFTVFPNPAKDVLYIKPAKTINKTATVNIYDMAGRIVGKHELRSNFGGIMQVQTAGYTPGTYQYEIQSGDVIMRGKFVKE